MPTGTHYFARDTHNVILRSTLIRVDSKVTMKFLCEHDERALSAGFFQTYFEFMFVSVCDMNFIYCICELLY